ncbi:MAG: hypothetical protein ACTSWZ_05780 [Candidatus Heimdallarchaeaceae archaeon]
MLISRYLEGEIDLVTAFSSIVRSSPVVRVTFLDRKPENSFRLNVFTPYGTHTLGDLVTRKNVDRAFDLAVVLYFLSAQRNNPSAPGSILGWYRGSLATTRHYMEPVRQRYQELIGQFPDLLRLPCET